MPSSVYGPTQINKLTFELTVEQNRELQRLINAPATPPKLLRRARIAVLAAEGQSNEAIAAALATSTVTVGLWRQRFVHWGWPGWRKPRGPGVRPRWMRTRRAGC